MIQTGLIQNAHSDLVTDASYNYYGIRLATCGLDQRIKVWQLDETNGTWSVEDDWKAHDAAVSKVSWAHPEFGPIIASSSYDRTVKIWEQITSASEQQPVTINGNGAQTQPSSSRWVERAVLLDARGTVRAVEFAPHHFGLKLATISTDNFLRIYECLEQPSLTIWQLSEEVDVLSIPSHPSPSYHSRAQTVALATPTQSHAPLDGASASLVAQALLQQQGPTSTAPSRPGLGNREADGGWCISWCKDRYWGEIIAAGCGITGLIKIIQLSPSRRPTTLLVLDPNNAGQATPVPALPASKGSGSKEGSLSGSPSGQGGVNSGTDNEQPIPHSVTSVAWAPSCGRSYHLVATGSRDGRVRIWKVKSAPDLDEDDDEVDASEEMVWTATLVADHDDHKSSVGRVDWNITGTVLSSAGNDGRIRLWKANVGGSIWRPAGTIGVEQGQNENDHEDVAMQS
ncbi:nuclear pore protein seh1 [Moniliophthora roreri]|uniref:Nuclear pore protein seh1 n=1 Tax=Moniliophthora roreri TaxID=221103 RepID=A0A0W0FXW2_MONRR|nr:nuclear pore protein seh1 [Moniliophthora roreri]